MATGTITSTGLGSGLDIETLVTKLMSIEQQPITQLQTREKKETAKLSALGQLKSALSNLQSAAQALDTRTEFASMSASVADAGVATASASASAHAGSYNIEVSRLADAQKVVTNGFASLTSAVTAQSLPQTLTLEIGTTTFDASGNPTGFTADSTKTKTITLDSSTNTLQGLRDAINGANAGVSASIVNDGSGTPYRLVLTSSTTGTASTFKLSGLGDLSYDPGTGTGSNITNIQNAADAQFKVDGIAITKQGNVVTDVIEGVTLKLAKTNQGAPTKLTVTSDSAAVETKVSSFVKAYNDLLSQIKSLTSYNAETNVAATLNGDSTVRSIKAQLNNIVTSTVGSGSLTRLSEVGITFTRDGALDLDSSKLQAALSDPAKDVAGLFVKGSANPGVASKIDAAISAMLDTGGLLAGRTEGINAGIKNIDKRIEALQSRMTAIEARYRAQFTALDSTISSLNNTSSYLTQQLEALANLSYGKNN